MNPELVLLPAGGLRVRLSEMVLQVIESEQK